MFRIGGAIVIITAHISKYWLYKGQSRAVIFVYNGIWDAGVAWSKMENQRVRTMHSFELFVQKRKSHVLLSGRALVGGGS